MRPLIAQPLGATLSSSEREYNLSHRSLPPPGHLAVVNRDHRVVRNLSHGLRCPCRQAAATRPGLRMHLHLQLRGNHAVVVRCAEAAAVSAIASPVAFTMARPATSTARTRRQIRAVSRHRRASHPAVTSLAPSIANAITITANDAAGNGTTMPLIEKKAAAPARQTPAP